MSRKTMLSMLTCCVLIAMAAANIQPGPVRAESGVVVTVSADGEDFDAQIVVKGMIESITPQNKSVSIMVVDGTPILVNPASQGADGLEVGQNIVVVASIDDEQLVAKIITAAEGTDVPTVEATLPVTAEPTVEATSEATPAATLPATPAATAAALCGGNNQHPVATRMAAAFGVSYDEIMGWHCKGYGFGEIAKAYLLGKKTGKAPADYFGMRANGKGWGQIVKDEGVKPQDLAPGQIGKGDDGSDKGNNGKGNSADKKNNGKGNGNGKGPKNK